MSNKKLQDYFGKVRPSFILKFYSIAFLEGLWKTVKISPEVVDLQAEIWTEQIPNWNNW